MNITLSKKSAKELEETMIRIYMEETLNHIFHKEKYGMLASEDRGRALGMRQLAEAIGFNWRVWPEPKTE